VSGVIVPAALLAFAASLLVAILVWRAGVLDLPEARSLHTRPTPRGGGLGVLAAAPSSPPRRASPRWGWPTTSSPSPPASSSP
jgi:hypothetical protein